MNEQINKLIKINKLTNTQAKNKNKIIRLKFD